MAQEEAIPVTEFANTALEALKEPKDEMSMSPDSSIDRDAVVNPMEPDSPSKTESDQSNTMEVDTSREPSDEDDVKVDTSNAQWTCSRYGLALGLLISEPSM